MSDKSDEGVSDRIRVGVAGAQGHMGRTTCAAIAGDQELRLVAVIDPAYASDGAASDQAENPGQEPRRFVSLTEAIKAADMQVVVDFTNPSAVRENILACVRGKVPVVVGTSGLEPADLAEIGRETAREGVPVLVAPNFAMGAVLMTKFAREAAQYLSACEIVEMHHESKVDAPSGTSRLTRAIIEKVWRARGCEREVPIHSVRLPGLLAHQQVIFGGLGETLNITHNSLSRDSFMPGVLLAVKRVRRLQGLVVGLENIL